MDNNKGNPLAEALKKAEDELKNVHSELHAVNQKLNASEAFKSHFISHISNELINPFTSITGMSKSILSKPEMDPKQVKKMVEYINNEAFYLEFQLKNLFAAAQLEAGEFYPEISEILPLKLIKELSNKFNNEAAKKEIKIKHETYLESDIHFKSDSEKLNTILSNLISNAINYSYPESEIMIRSSLEEGVLVISVSNSGPKIPENQSESIYDRFTRLNTEINSVNQGSGVGLSICKGLVDILQGKIGFQSIEDQMVFSIEIPESSVDIESFDLTDDDLFFDE